MELDQLRNFLSVAEHESFTHAAEAIALSQPALSRSISKLEAEIGQPLFDRQTRKVALTDAGKLLLNRARQILRMVDDLKTEICDDGKTGAVRIGAIPTIAPYFLPSRIHRFQKAFPQATVIVQEDTTANLISKLADGIVDVAIAASPIEGKYLDVLPLFEEELLLVLSENHPLASRKTIYAADIESLPFVLLGEAHCLTGSVVNYCQHKEFHPLSVERTSQLAMVQELVSLNHGISFIPAMARELDTSPSRVYRSMSGPKPKRTIVMVINPYRFQSKLLKGFLQTLKASVDS